MIYWQLVELLLLQNSIHIQYIRLLESLGAKIIGFNFIIVLEFLNAR